MGRGQYENRFQQGSIYWKKQGHVRWVLWLAERLGSTGQRTSHQETTAK